MTYMRVGVLGLGSIGARHFRNLLSLGVSVLGFDPDLARHEKLMPLGGGLTRDRENVLEESDAIVIASPSGEHAADLRDAVNSGCHCFVEKPLSHAPGGMTDVLDRAGHGGLIVFSGMNLRFHPAVAAARAAIESGSIGRILWGRFIAASYLPDWRPGGDYRCGYAADPVSGGILFDDVHEIDLANHLLGPASVAAAVARCTGELEIESEDCADIILRHESGAISSIHMDYVTRVRMRVADIAGSDGFLRVDVSNRRFEHLSAVGETIRDERAPGSVEDDYRTEMRAFLDCIRSGTAPQCDGVEAYAILEQVFAARRAAGLPQVEY